MNNLPRWMRHARFVMASLAVLVVGTSATALAAPAKVQHGQIARSDCTGVLALSLDDQIGGTLAVTVGDTVSAAVEFSWG